MDFSLSTILEIWSSGMETMEKSTSTNLSYLTMFHKKALQTLATQASKYLTMSQTSKGMVLQSTPTSETTQYGCHQASRHQMLQEYSLKTRLADSLLAMEGLAML